MIRFIASDLDGTLLDRKGGLPEEIFPLVSRLSELGVLFAPASGRQYANLKKLFFPVREKLLFICENGALVRRGEKTIYANPVPAPLVKRALDLVRKEDGLLPILCCEGNAYVENAEFYPRAHATYTNCILTESLDDCIGKEPVCKISVFDKLGSAGHAMRLLPPLLEGVKAIQSGEYWCDVVELRTDKGEAVKEIQKKFDIPGEECMAFGDQMNDEGMLRACARSRAVENAVPAVKALAEKIVPSNAEGGVLLALKELIAETEKIKGV